jgi:hypothetical protein
MIPKEIKMRCLPVQIAIIEVGIKEKNWRTGKLTTGNCSQVPPVWSGDSNRHSLTHSFQTPSAKYSKQRLYLALSFEYFSLKYSKQRSLKSLL